MNSDKIILDLCAGTGAWSKPYKDAGYDVRICTTPDCDVRTYRPPANVYGILAAPPCTSFSLAAGKSLEQRDVREGLEVMNSCLKIVQECKPKFWALENPVGYMRRFMGLPPFTFRQWEFGDLGIKPTDIWGFYNLPTKKVKIRPPKEQLLYISAGGSSNRIPRKILGAVAMRSSEKGSITPQGFAQAFFRVNQ